MFILSWMRSAEAQQQELEATTAAAAAAAAAADGTTPTGTEVIHQETKKATVKKGVDGTESDEYDFNLEDDSATQEDDWILWPETNATTTAATTGAMTSASSTSTTTATTTTTTHSMLAGPPRPLDATLAKVLEVATTTTTTTVEEKPKSRKQQKQEQRLRLAQQEQERIPRYDPLIAKQRDLEFKKQKMERLGLRSGNVGSKTTLANLTGGPGTLLPALGRVAAAAAAASSSSSSSSSSSLVATSA